MYLNLQVRRNYRSFEHEDEEIKIMKSLITVLYSSSFLVHTSATRGQVSLLFFPINLIKTVIEVTMM